MSKLIAITGTHGTGKTTLSFILAAEYKKLGANVKIVQEVARSCPFPLNEKMTRETAIWIYHEHSKKELEALKDHDVVICDRTSFDSFVYAEYFGIDLPVTLKQFSKFHLYDYDKLYMTSSDYSYLPINDGVRSIDLYFQKEIDTLFSHHLKNLNLEIVKSKQIFDKEHIWDIYL